MLLKSADNKSKDIEILEGLLRHPRATPSTRQLIEREIRNIRSGIRGEAETAYELEFNFKSRNWVIIHDLRIEHGGRVAQIDHLLINRFMNMYVCESKRFSEGVAINPDRYEEPEEGVCVDKMDLYRYGAEAAAKNLTASVAEFKRASGMQP